MLARETVLCVAAVWALGLGPAQGGPGPETPRAARSVALPWRRRALEVRQGRARESRKGHAASCSAVRVRRGLLEGW